MQRIKMLSVLVIDENDTTLDQMCDALRDNGIDQLECARTILEAWNKIDEELAYKGRVFDFIFCNCRFNLEHGGPSLLIPKILDKHPSIITVMYSSGDDPLEHIVAMLVIGGADYLQTGENFSLELQKKLKKWLDIGETRLSLYKKGCCND